MAKKVRLHYGKQLYTYSSMFHPCMYIPARLQTVIAAKFNINNSAMKLGTNEASIAHVQNKQRTFPKVNHHMSSFVCLMDVKKALTNHFPPTSSYLSMHKNSTLLMPLQ